MHAILILYCVTCLMQFHSQICCHNLHSFLDKTLHMCHDVPKHKTPGKESYQQLKSRTNSYNSLGQEMSSDWQPRRGFTGSSLVYMVKSYLLCVKSYWESCTKQQDFNLTFSYRPCYFGNIHMWHKDVGLLIQVHHSFQINLTFTYFFLEHSHSECLVQNLHYVMVSTNSKSNIHGLLYKVSTIDF